MDTLQQSIVDGVVLADLDREMRELVDGCSAMGEQTPAVDVARLGLALATLTRILPQLAPSSQDYFRLLESTARAALMAIVMRQRHDCEGD